MGVRGLFSMMRERNLTSPIDIQQYAYNTRQLQGHCVVVDAMGLMGYLYCGLSPICGGEWTELYGVLKHFVDSFQRAGIRLVFFYDGNVEKKKRNVWLERRMREISDYDKFFETADKERGTIDSSIQFDIKFLPPGIDKTMRAIFQELGQEVYQSVSDGDWAIAEYAQRNRCLAVISEDSDFLIFQMNTLLISAQHLDITNLTSIVYDQKKLCDYLRLPCELLPLVASLNGNDYAPFDKHRPFHLDLRHRLNLHGRPFEAIGNYVSGMVASCRRTNVSQQISVILAEIISKYSDVLIRETIEESMQSYYFPEFWTGAKVADHMKKEIQKGGVFVGKQIFDELFKCHINSEVHECLLAVATGQDIHIGNSLQDRKNMFGLPPYSNLFSELEYRCLSVLLSVTDGKEVIVRCWDMATEEISRDEPKQVLLRPVRDAEGTPLTIDVLWDENTSDSTRLQAFCHILSFPSVVTCEEYPVPRSMWSVFSLILYLSLNSPITDLEIELLVYFMLEMHTSLPPPPPQLLPHARGVHLATLYCRGCQFIDMTLDVCGFKRNQMASNTTKQRSIDRCKVWKYFSSGVLFQYLFWSVCVKEKKIFDFMKAAEEMMTFKQCVTFIGALKK